jgi:hypothetical protein
MDKTSVSKTTNRRIRRWWTTARLARRFHTEPFARTIRDPFLPLLILGAVVVALFASFILKASADIVFGVIFIGCLTAFLEIMARNDNRD